MNQTIIVDNRWQGHHGIGRYAREIIGRLPADAISPYDRGKPLSPVDTITSACRNRQGYSYSPGFNFFNARLEKSIITVHDLAHLEVAEYRSTKNRLYYEGLIRPTCRRAPFVFTCSNVSRHKIAAWADIRAEKIIVTGNGISEAFGHEGRAHQAGYPYLLSVGSSKAHKNTDVLLAAFDRAKLPADCRLVLVGSFADYPARVATDRIIVRSGLADQQLAELYRGCQGLIQPSRYEGFGLPLAEGMACGAPIVASDIPIFHEVAGDAATFFDPLSVADLSSAMEALFRPDAERSEKIERGRRRSRRYRWEKVAGIVRENLLGLLQPRSTHRRPTKAKAVA